MFHIALYQPEIPPNTGNIIRLCANTGAQLHLIQPLGFTYDDKRVRRAGLDYHELSVVHHYENYATWLKQFCNHRIFACSTKGTRCYSEPSYQTNDVFLFGPETRGLPKTVLDLCGTERSIRIPMVANSRSLNLSNAVAVILYEAWRQDNFNGS